MKTHHDGGLCDHPGWNSYVQDHRPAEGGVSINLDDFAAFLPRVKQATGAVVNIWTGGSLKNTIEERIAPALRFCPEMCGLNIGSMNISFHPLAKRHDKWKFDWEKEYVRKRRHLNLSQHVS